MDDDPARACAVPARSQARADLPSGRHVRRAARRRISASKRGEMRIALSFAPYAERHQHDENDRHRSQQRPALAIGRRIRALRREAGLTQEKLAYESDLGSKGYLSDIEKGLALPTVKTLRVLAERLDVLVLDLVTDPEADPRQKLIDRTRGLTRGTLRKLLRQVPATTSRRDAP